MRIIFAEGPRNAINAMTLYSVMQLNLLPNGKHAASNGHTPIVQFFYNVQALANSDREQAAILFGMLFSFIIWVISALGLIAAFLIYITFLWHHIPSNDGGLSGFCKRKIDNRLQKIIGIKIEKALAQENRAAFRKESGIGERPNPIKRQPTIPLLTTEEDDKLQSMPTLSRQTTQSTLPPYKSSPNGDLVPNFGHQPILSREPSRPAFPSRSETQSSVFTNISCASDVPLMDAAMPMGYVPPDRSYSPIHPLRNISRTTTSSERPMVQRNVTSYSKESQRPFHNPSYGPSMGRSTPGPPKRQNTGTSDYFTSAHFPNKANSQDRRAPSQQISPIDTFGRRTPEWSVNRQTPVEEYEMHTQPSSRSKSRYQAYNPNMCNTPTDHTPASAFAPPSSRNFTVPNRQSPNEYFPSQPLPPQRSGTAPLPQTARHADSHQSPYEFSTANGSSRPLIPARAATTTPGVSAWKQSHYAPGPY